MIVSVCFGKPAETFWLPWRTCSTNIERGGCISGRRYTHQGVRNAAPHEQDYNPARAGWGWIGAARGECDCSHVHRTLPNLPVNGVNKEVTKPVSVTCFPFRANDPNPLKVV
eukprot:97992-Amphidinium_carterae.1